MARKAFEYWSLKFLWMPAREALSELELGIWSFDLALTQPRFGCVLYRREFLRSFQSFIIKGSFFAIYRQRQRKTLRKAFPEIDTLNAALMQQTRARPALRRSGNLLSI